MCGAYFPVEQTAALKSNRIVQKGMIIFCRVLFSLNVNFSFGDLFVFFYQQDFLTIRGEWEQKTWGK